MNNPQDNQDTSEQVQNTPPIDNVSRMIEMRRRKLSGQDISFNQESNNVNENADHEKLSSEKEFNKSNNKEEKESSNDSQSEINKLNSRLEDSQKYSRVVSRRMGDIVKHFNQSIQELVENGDLSEEHGKNLLSALNKNELKKPEGLTIDDEPKADPFQKFYEIANPLEIQTYKAYTQDEEYIDKINAFNAFMNQSSQEEKDEMYNILNDISQSPPELVRKMMEIGNNFLDEGYRDLIKAGSLRKYMKSNKENRSNKEKEIDSLKKKTVKYNQDYDSPTYSFENHSISPLKVENPNNDRTQSSKKDNTQLFLEKRDKIVQQQQFGNQSPRR